MSVTVGGQSHPLKPVTLAGHTDVYEAVVSGDQRNQAYRFRVGGNTVRDPYARSPRV